MKVSIILEALTGTFETDMRRAEKATKDAAQSMVNDFKRFGAAAGLAFAGAATAFAGMAKGAINAADETNKAAQKIGIATASLSELQYAARLSDVSLTTLQGGMVRLVKEMTNGSAAFDALGVKTRDSSGKLRDVGEVFRDVAEELWNLDDGALKTRLAIDLFGRSGANLLPMLNAGRDGLAEMADEARRMGAVLDGDTGRRAEEFSDTLERMGAAIDGIVLQSVRELLPEMQELANRFNDPQFREGIATIVAGSVTAVAAVGELVLKLGELAKFGGEDLAEAFGGTDPSDLVRLQAAYRALSDEYLHLKQVYDSSLFTDARREEQLESMRGALGKLQEQIKNAIILQDVLNDSGVEGAKTNDAQKRAAEDLGKAQADLEKRLKAYLDSLNKANNSGTQAKVVLREMQEVCTEFDPVLQDLRKGFEQSADAAAEFAQQRAGVTGMLDDLRFEASLIGASNADRERAIALRQAGAAATAEERAEIVALIDQLRAGDEMEAAAREFQSIWLDAANNVGDALTTALFDGAEDGADAIKDVMKQLARDLVRFWLQQNIVIPLQQQLLGGMGGGFNFASLFGAAAGGGGTSWLSSLGSLFGTSNGMSGGFNVPNLTSLGGAGGGNIFSSALGAFTGYGQFGTAAGWSAAAASGPPSALAGAASSFGWIPIVGWILAAMAANDSLFAQGWRPNQSNLSLPDGTRISGGGSSFGRHLDSFFGQSGLLDDRTISLLSGSAVATRLFGHRAPRVTTGETTFDFGGEEVGGGQRFRTLEEGGIFRSDRRRWHSIALSGEALEAAQALFDELQTTMRVAADRLRADAPEMLDASLQIVQEYDKKGKVKATEYIVEALGRTWKEATEEFARLRLNSEAIVATIDSALGGTEASQIAERWRAEVEEFAAGAEFLLGVAADLRGGFDLLGTGTLAPIVDLVEELQSSGETLADTYLRLATSTRQLEDALDLMGVSLDLSRTDFVRFAADITEAAGGFDRAAQLWAGLARFFTPQELAQLRLDSANEVAGAEFSDIGLNASDFLGEGGGRRFLDMFREVLPTLGADAVVEWLEAAEALGIAIDAQTAYNAALGETVEAIDEIEFDESAARDYARTVASINDQLADMDGATDFQRQLRAIAVNLRNNIDTLNETAQAAGLQSAREEDLGRAHLLAARQAAQAIAQLEAAGRQIAAQLFGPDGDALADSIDDLREGIGATSDGLTRLVLGAQLQALEAEQRQQQRMARDAERFGLGTTLASFIADLAGAMGITYEEAFQRLSGGQGSMAELAEVLGLDGLDELNTYFAAIQADSYSLADLAATVTAGEQLIVDTLRDLFDAEHQTPAYQQLAPGVTKPIDLQPDLPPIPGIINKSARNEVDQLLRRVDRLVSATEASAAAAERIASSTSALPRIESQQRFQRLAETTATPRSLR